MFARLKSFLLASAFVLLIALVSKAAVTQLVLYDNFASRNIDHSKWNGWQFFDLDVVEATRQLVGEEESRRLHLALTAYSSTADNSTTKSDMMPCGFLSLAWPTNGA